MIFSIIFLRFGHSHFSSHCSMHSSNRHIRCPNHNHHHTIISRMDHKHRNYWNRIVYRSHISTRVMSIVTQHVQPPIITTYISIPRSAMHLQIRHSNTKSILKKMESATRIAPIWAANMADTFSFH